MGAIAAVVDWSGAIGTTEILGAMLAPLRSSYPVTTTVREGRTASLGELTYADDERDPDRAIVIQAPTIGVAIDARLDNGAALRRTLDLSSEGTDAELVAEAYRRWGDEFPCRLRGDFAFVLWDSGRRRVIAARDHFGVRPLYHARLGTSVLIASDPEQILATGLVAPVPDDAGVVAYLHWKADGHETSFFRDIRRVPGGHVLTADAATSRLVDYRRIVLPEIGFATHEECWEELRRALSRSVVARLASRHPVIVQLSGGVDSTSIACLADAAWASNPALCPSITAAGAVHPGLSSDEAGFIRAAAETLRFPVETWDGSLADENELDRSPVWAPGARYSLTGGTEGDVLIAKRLGARVILGGSGGDQMGIPDGATEDAIVEGRWRDAYHFLAHVPGLDWRVKLRDAASVAKSLSPPWLASLHRSKRGAEQRPTWTLARHQGMGPEAGPEDHPTFQWATHLQRRRWRALSHPRFVGSHEVIQHHALRMGLEHRSPFLDWDLAQLILAIPAKFWPPPWPQERLHREALLKVLPAPTARRRTKAQFQSTLANRVRVQWDKINDLLGAGEWLSQGYVDRQAVRRELEAFARAPSPSFSMTWAIWGTASLEAWLRIISRYTPASGGGT